MKRSALALATILALLISVVAGVRFAEVTKANFIPSAEIEIASPTNSTYNSNSLLLEYGFGFSFTEKKSVTYSIDGKANVTIFSSQSAPQLWEGYDAKVVLPELSDGSHHLEVYAENVGSGYAQVYFTIDTTPPHISDLSVENKTYNSTVIPLNFTVDEPTTWIGYSIDRQSNTTIIGNTTLAGLSEGSHSLTVYANDTAGNVGTSQTIYFTISQKINRETQPQPEPFSTLLVVAVSVAVSAVVALGFLVYWKKHKKPILPPHSLTRNQLSQLALTFLVFVMNESQNYREAVASGICSTFVQKYPHMFNFKAILCPYG
jgi:hypothetical protein